MRNNQPITDQEHHLDPKCPLVSLTDLKGVILHANQSFVEISGYRQDELLGQPHNLIRHPDMPAEAFEDMWRTLKADLPWRGIVKNRCKNGDFYWVEAYVTPLIEDGRKVGYMSVRTRPTPRQITEANALYQAVNHRSIRFPATRYRRDTSVTARLALMALLPALCFGAALCLGDHGRWLAAGAGVLAAPALGLWTWLGIVPPMKRSGEALLKIASGDLRFELDTRASSEFFRLLIGIQSMKVGLRAVFADILSIAGHVESQSHALNDQVDMANQRIHLGADSVRTMAAAIEQLTESVSEISLATQSSAGQATLTAEKVSQGLGQIVDTQTASLGVVSRMDSAQQLITELKSEVASIQNLAEIIKEIADQTNLLALNAAIEAARAGETGRGFAVVADEVRKLAERTSSSTVEITATVERIGTCTANTLSAMAMAAGEVQISHSLMNESRETYDAIQRSADGIQSSSRNIAAMLQQQEHSSSEVAGKIEEISQLVEQNSSSVESIHKAARQLGHTAQQLHAMTSRFEHSL
ncbi:methyl-accepting chemotaxis protein [Chromobacterium paludis]|nr:PAS domain-containing methyl-accepting chemotaxis protein [Chromobacterium paludis]